MKQPVQSKFAKPAAVENAEHLDDEPTSHFDSLIELAASLCDTPIALISLDDHGHHSLKASMGLKNFSNFYPELFIRSSVTDKNGLYEVPDTQIIPRLLDHAFFTDNPDIHFYASCALQLSNGASIGSFCVMGYEPKYLTKHQRNSLKHLSGVAVSLLETRTETLAFSEKESQLRLLSEASPLGIFKCDFEGNCDYVNKSWQTISDMTAAEAVGLNWTKAIHPDDKSAVFTHWSEAGSMASPADIKFRIKHKNGATRYVRVVSSQLLSEHGTPIGFVATLEDITTKRNQEEALRKSALLLEQTGALANIGGWELDLKTQSLLWSKQTCRIHGLPITYQPKVETAIEFFAPEARPVIRDALDRGIRDGRGWDLELPLIRVDGSTIWVRVVGQIEQENGKPRRIYGAFQNVSDKVIQRKSIEYAHERITTATESGNIGVWDWNPITNALDWTPKMFNLFGLTFSGTASSYKLWANTIHPDDLALAEVTLKNAVNDVNAKDFDTEFRVVWPDKSIHNIRATAQITRNEKGQAQRFLGVNWDVTPLHSLRSELTAKHDLLHVTLQSIGDAVITTDTSGSITWLNPTAELMTGWLVTEALGRPVSDVFKIYAQTTRIAKTCPVQSCLETVQINDSSNESILISRDGGAYGIEESAAPITNSKGVLLGSVLVFRDVTDQRRQTQAMRYRATHDSLTGLVNRIEFETKMQKAVDEAHRSGTEHSLLYIDLDQFKLVNDACGHAVGDLLLQEMAKLLSNSIGSNDVIGRLGGDEFAVILNDCDTIQAENIAQRMCQAMDDYRFVHEERRFRIGTSIGLVPLDKRWNNIEAAMQAADSACYAAKDAGRNRVHLWFDTVGTVQVRQQDTELANQLAAALDNEGFVLYAQRISSNKKAKNTLDAEILLRLDNQGSLLPPNTFLPAAERFSFANRIDLWVLSTVTNILSTQTDLSTIDTLFINLSAQSVGDISFMEEIVSLFQKVGTDVSSRICIDITETAVASNFNDIARFISTVRAQNVRVALDHFGGNSSTFSYLKELEIDFIKIDGKLVNGMMQDPIDASMVRSIIDVANVLNVPTIASHISNKKTLSRVEKLGVEHAQGFHLHKPEPLENLLNHSMSQH